MVVGTEERTRLQLVISDIYYAMGRGETEGAWHTLMVQALLDLDGSFTPFDKRSLISYETRMVRSSLVRGRFRDVVKRLQPPLRMYTDWLASGRLFPSWETNGMVRLLRLLAVAQRALGQAAAAAALEADLDETEAIVAGIVRGAGIEVPGELLEERGEKEEGAAEMDEDAAAGTESQPECCICLGPVPDGVGLLLVCSDTFHMECLARWKAKCFFEGQPFTCAMCRQPVVAAPVAQEGEGEEEK